MQSQSKSRMVETDTIHARGIGISLEGCDLCAPSRSMVSLQEIQLGSFRELQEFQEKRILDLEGRNSRLKLYCFGLGFFAALTPAANLGWMAR